MAMREDESTRVLTLGRYENAFGCLKSGVCPQSQGEDGCPLWVGRVETIENERDGELERVETWGCAPVVRLDGETAMISRIDVAINTAAGAKTESTETRRVTQDLGRLVVEESDRQRNALALLFGAVNRVDDQSEKKPGRLRSALNRLLPSRLG